MFVLSVYQGLNLRKTTGFCACMRSCTARSRTTLYVSCTLHSDAEARPRPQSSHAQVPLQVTTEEDLHGSETSFDYELVELRLANVFLNFVLDTRHTVLVYDRGAVTDCSIEMALIARR